MLPNVDKKGRISDLITILIEYHQVIEQRRDGFIRGIQIDNTQYWAIDAFHHPDYQESLGGLSLGMNEGDIVQLQFCRCHSW